MNLLQLYLSERPLGFDVYCGGGGMPAPPKPPAPPTTNDAAAKARRELDKRKPQGFASTILTGGLGDSSTGAVQKKTLLGS